MRNAYRVVVTLVAAAVSLSSCSRANYAFNNNVPAYLGSEQVHAPVATTLAPESVATVAAPDAAMQVVAAAPVQHTTRHMAHRAITHATANAEVSTTAAPEKVQLSKADRKAFKKELKRQLAAAPQGTTAEGKSQLVALLLNIFLGGLGIHRFYLGYVGMGILYIALLLTSFLIVPAIALFVLLVIDLIRIITGSLKPKNGEYGKTL
jgi:hypothetical protein